METSFRVLVAVVLGLSQGCNPNNLDQDGDGFTKLTNDCDDTDPNVHPDAVEVCYNGKDDNCNGVEDEEGATSGRVWYIDLDGDGYGKEEATVLACEQPDGYAANKWDCQEDNADIHPGAVEVCDYVDNDCDGEIDETTAEDALLWYPDGDGDGYGDMDAPRRACESPGAGWVQDGTDCNDGDPLVSPEQTENCLTSIDDDCDGLLSSEDAFGCEDWYADLDGDGFPGSRACLCEPDEQYFGTEPADCDDEDPEVYPGTTAEDAGWSDRDCDGVIRRELADADLRFEVSDRLTTASNTVRAVTWTGGDLDGDGLDDIGVAVVPRSNPGPRAVYVASGATLSEQHDLPESATAVLTASAAGVDWDTVMRNEAGFEPQIQDLDGDGLGDLVVVRDVQTPDGGYAYETSVFLGPVTGALDIMAADSTLQVPKSSGVYSDRNLRPAGGWSDGRALLAVSDTTGGSEFVGSGGLVSLLGWETDGLAVIDTIVGINPGQGLGHEVGDAGDMDGDGIRDRVVAAKGVLTSDPFGQDRSSLGGVVEVFTDGTGVPETSVVSNAYYRRIVEHLGGPGDLDGDGHPDLVFSAQDSHIGAYNAGRVHVLWGPLEVGTVELVTQDQLVIRGEVDDQDVSCPAVIPDTDGDGRDDLAIGAYSAWLEDGTRGSTYVWLGERLDTTLVAGDGMAVMADRQPGSMQNHGYCTWQWRAVGSPGDVDGDGLGDILVRGALDPASDPEQTDSLFLFLGGGL